MSKWAQHLPPIAVAYSAVHLMFGIPSKFHAESYIHEHKVRCCWYFPQHFMIRVYGMLDLSLSKRRHGRVLLLKDCLQIAAISCIGE